MFYSQSKDFLLKRGFTIYGKENCHDVFPSALKKRIMQFQMVLGMIFKNKISNFMLHLNYEHLMTFKTWMSVSVWTSKQ